MSVRKGRGGAGRRISDLLAGTVPADLIPLVPDRFEVIGDIAVISIPPELLPYRAEIADSLMKTRRSIRTVLRRISHRDGLHRVALYEPVTGSGTTTRYREFGFVYRVDLAQAFCSTRLAGERRRIAIQIRPGERVFIPYAGYGPFVIPAAAQGAEVVALEINPTACRLLAENLRTNHLEQSVLVIRGDAWKCRIRPGTTDRAIIPSPYGSDRIPGPAAEAVRPGGWIHLYTLQPAREAEQVREELLNAGYRVARYHRCGNVAPGISRWVYDLQKPPEI